MDRRLERGLIRDELKRQLSFSKRRNGLIKKAMELFLVCGVDCVFISFSECGRLNYFCGDKRFEELIARFLALPDHIRQFHLSNEEVQQLHDILRELREETEEQVRNDRAFSGTREEVASLKEQLESVKLESSEYGAIISRSLKPAQGTNNDEDSIQESLDTLAEIKKELPEDDDTNNDASQQSEPTIGAENSSTNISDDIHLLQLAPPAVTHRGNDRGKRPMHSSAAESSSSNAITKDMEVTSAPVILESSLPRDQNNSSSFQQNQYNMFKDGILNTNFSANGSATGGNQASCSNGSTFGALSNCSLPVKSLASLGPQLSLSQASFPVHQQMMFQQQPSNAVSAPLMQPPNYQMQGGTDNGMLSGTQLPNDSSLLSNVAAFGQRGSFQDLLSLVSGLNMYTPAQPSPFSMAPNPLNNNQQGMHGFQKPAEQNHPEKGEGSSSSSRKRKSSWDDNGVLSLATNVTDQACAPSNSAPPAPRHQTRNGVYDPAYEAMGLPLDPKFRAFLNHGNCNQEEEDE